MSFLEVKNVCKKFASTEVLQSISFSLEKGEVLSIIGSSGSGKTTLLRCLNSLDTPDDGQISVAGRVVFDSRANRKSPFFKRDAAAKGDEKKADCDAAVSPKPEEKQDLRQLIEKIENPAAEGFGLVFQNFNLFPQYTALKNVTLAMDVLSKKRMKECGVSFFMRSKLMKELQMRNEERAKGILQRVNMAEKADSYPYQLSGGQCQRVAIARALALSPAVLCFDEPTSALDPLLTNEVLAVIRSLKSKDMTMIIVTHEMEFARGVSDKIAFMSEGVISDFGTPDEIFGEKASDKLKSFLSGVHGDYEEQA